ncbi:hypothetical protein QR680_013301 [Steinernema hermaphroditum]|uniref:EF-hand domain-containing protein n=1 Tax=Steinernema hermaphroditum TaxID=289476 RepID=A0AA39M297_9BILA|nr:hypothetical protein QR680_013301 [Steinernema hermaphroditum]
MSPIVFTTRLTGIGIKTVREIVQGDLNIAARSVVDGTFWYKMPSCGLKTQNVSKTERWRRLAAALDEQTRNLIVRTIDDLHRSEKPVTVANVIEALTEDIDHPVGRTTVLGILHGLGYGYKKIDNRVCLYDDPRIVSARKMYIERIDALRRQGYSFYYVDETWCFKGMKHRRDWCSNLSPHEKKAAGLCSGPNTPANRGKRIIVLDAIGLNGFVQGALRIYSGKHEDGDYHKEMNSEVFESYMQDLLRILKEQEPLAKICIIFDNASYHSRSQEQLPTTQWRKPAIVQFLNLHEIPYDPAALRLELLQTAKDWVAQREDQVRRRRVDEMCANEGVVLLRLPPYHAQLNPIELAWGWLKGEMRKIIRTMTPFNVDRSPLCPRCSWKTLTQRSTASSPLVLRGSYNQLLRHQLVRAMSSQEQVEIQEVFHFYDVRGDDKITVKQIGTALRSLGQFPTEAQIETLTKQWEDKETRISIEEFAPILHSVQKHASKLPTHEEFAECLTHFDRDRSGQIGIVELRHMLENNGEKLAEEEVDLLLRGLPDDHGKININELVRLVLA